ncbi:MAG: hypothetical protein MAG451_00025 [Anaerolineales bacterium]|nr:hypothetical protein [Anaerolineales bacterium]
MAHSERIQEHVEKSPAPFQAEVLNFVEYLLAKAEREAVRQERKLWSSLSLSSAMRGMEDEDIPTYTTADLKVVFS